MITRYPWFLTEGVRNHLTKFVIFIIFYRPYYKYSPEPVNLLTDLPKVLICYMSVNLILSFRCTDMCIEIIEEVLKIVI